MLGINIDDILNVLYICLPFLIALGVVLVLGIVIIIACRKLSKDKKYLVRSQTAISMALAVIIIANLICFGPMSTLLSLVSNAKSISEESTLEAQALCEQVAEDGIVLLENNNLLPLNKGSKLNVFGWSSTNPCYGGTGSGGLNDLYPIVSLLEGLNNEGIETNTALSDFYTAYRADRPVIGMWEQDWTLPEPPANTYSTELIDQAKDFSDTALVVITRVGGEGADLPTDMREVEYQNNSDEYGDFEPGQHFLSLTKTERDMLDLVSANFKEIILVYNSANTFELGFVRDYPNIKSVVWCPGTGQNGFNSLGRILNGDINPSGKTSDIFVRNLAQTPYFNNIGYFNYDNMDEFAYEYEPGESWTPYFVNYTEGIYIGYRFYETAAKEGLIDYEQAVLYPFGHGLSYTEFSQKMGNVSENDDTISFDVTVTNTGRVPGKDVVEIYYEPPYKNGGIEKSCANLVAFEKTGLLNAGESQTISISIPIEDMASYDSTGTGGYTLDDGDYVISLNRDSHTIVDSHVFTLESVIEYTGANKRGSDDVAASNQFNGVDGGHTYLSRKDGFSNYKAATSPPESHSMPEEFKAKFINNSNYNTSQFDNPADTAPVLGAKNGIKLAELRGKEYDDPLWDTLLDQLNIKEMNALISQGGYQTLPIASVGKIQTIDCDGPAAINNNFTGLGSIGLPAAVMVSSSWNKELATEFGNIIGKMSDDMGVSGWYAPGLNLHRSAFSGRNFEYYSEDGFLAGSISAATIKGAREHGVYSYMKHFALNDQENARELMLCTWANEQTIREMYLKPFELAVKAGGSQAAMSSFNYIGTEWAGGSSSLLNNVLRDEWGFRGMVISDYFLGMGYMNADQAIRNGNDMCLVAYDVGVNNIQYLESPTSLLAMRQACKNILYTVVNSRAYAPENLVSGPQSWQIVLVGISAILFLGLVLLEVLVVRKGYKKRKAETTTLGSVKLT